MATLANITVLILIGMLIRIVIMAYKYILIQDAIYKYRMYCIKHWEKANVDFGDMVKFSDVFLNLAKWRYTDILPKEKFEIIKPYMK